MLRNVRSTRLFQILPLLLLSSIATIHLTACSTQPARPADQPQKTTELVSAGAGEAQLDPGIVESSGLVCLADGTFLTINDSGNAANVYQLNAQGKVLAQFPIDAVNKDWEAMTLHQEELWIADIGNNSGARNGGDLYRATLPLRIDKANSTVKTSFVYPDLPQPPLQIYQHDFDAEALVSAGQQLFLFNKAWQSPFSTVYQLTTEANGTNATRIATIDGLPGVITGGSYSSEQQLFVLTGYARFRENVLRMALYNDYQPFLAVVDRQFKLQKVIPIAQGGQLEAICIDQQQQIWLTQERSKSRPALIWRWGSIQQLKQ